MYNEHTTVRCQHACRFREHAPQRLGREVFEHVQGEGLGEGAVRERQLAQIGDQEIDVAAGIS